MADEAEEDEDASPFAAFDLPMPTWRPRHRAKYQRLRAPVANLPCPYLPRPKVANAVHVIVLMHPKELEREISTAKLAAMSLCHCDVLVGRDLSLCRHRRVRSPRRRAAPAVADTPVLRKVGIVPG